MTRRLLYMFLAVFILMAAVEVLLPWALAQSVAQGMKNLVKSDQVEARLEKSPAVLMLAGSFDAVRLQAVNARIDKLVFSEMNAVLNRVQLDMGSLITRRMVALKAVGDVDLKAVMTQEELARYLNQTVKGVKNATVNISPERVQVSAGVALGGLARLDVTLDGRIVSDGQKIKFVTNYVQLNKTRLGTVGGALLSEVALVDVNKLPFGVTVRDIIMENGKITLTADNRVKSR